NNNTNPGTQQYQNQATDYLNQAQKTNHSTISQQLNLDLAKTNAMMAGNHQQVSQIEQLQNQKRNQANQQIINGVFSLLNSFKQESEIKKAWQADYIRRDFERATRGDTMGMYFLAYKYTRGNRSIGFIPDLNQAVYWYCQAANLGHKCSLFGIAEENSGHFDNSSFSLNPKFVHISPESKAISLPYLCSAYILLGSDSTLKSTCSYGGNVPHLKRLIINSLFYLYPLIRNDAGTDLLHGLYELFNEKRLEIEYLLKDDKLKSLAKQEKKILAKYLEEIQEELKNSPDVAKPVIDSDWFESFVKSNMLPQFHQD
ncbi:MAG: SEL1-like repeat protein, partial [Melioribacteraceae bacterium]|nr:SEL1-like repeat protein [Melioribacteraceae bacterium]